MRIKDKLNSQLDLLKDIISANPCGMTEQEMDVMSRALDIVLNNTSMTFNYEQLAKWMNVSRRTLQRWKKNKGLPSEKRKGSRELAFRMDKVTEWMFAIRRRKDMK